MHIVPKWPLSERRVIGIASKTAARIVHLHYLHLPESLAHLPGQARHKLESRVRILSRHFGHTEQFLDADQQVWAPILSKLGVGEHLHTPFLVFRGSEELHFTETVVNRVEGGDWGYRDVRVERGQNVHLGEDGPMRGRREDQQASTLLPSALTRPVQP